MHATRRPRALTRPRAPPELGRLVEVPHPETPIVRELSLVHRGVDRLPPAAAALRRQLLGLEE